MLNIKSVEASIDDKKILKGVDIEVPAGEVHAIMGPNGAGKSTLANVLAGHPDYSFDSGSLSIDGVDLKELSADERAIAGLFLGFQYPMEIPGITVSNFIREAVNSIRERKGLDRVNIREFTNRLKDEAKALGLSDDALKRHLGVGFSGGEKKRLEMLQMIMFDPKVCLLDETDSGLDIDAMKIVANAINRMRTPEHSVLLITHYRRLLDYVKPDKVHVFVDGKVVESGDFSLVEELEKDGYERFLGGK